MKFSHITQLGDILRFQVYATDLLYISKYGIYLNDKLFEQPNQFNVAYFWNNFVIYGNLENMSMYSLLNENITQLEPKYSYYWNFYNEENSKMLISQNRRTNESGNRIADYYLFNLKNKTAQEYLFTEKPQIKVIGNKGVIIKDATLFAYSLLTGLYLWEVDLSIQNLKIYTILGIKDENLIIVCENKEQKNILLSLDVNTGKEIWVKDMNFGKDRFIFNSDNSTIINLYARGFWLEERRIAVGNNIFREINTKDGSVKREGMLDELDKVGLSIGNHVLQEDKIYFTARYKNSFDGVVVGVLDYETLSLLWWEEVKMDEADGFGNFLTQIQVSENKIYVLDKTGTLHIYERDDTKPYEKPTKSSLISFEYLPIFEEPPHYPENDDLPF